MLVPRMLRSAISAFTRVFDYGGALLIRAYVLALRGGSRFCGAPPSGAAPRPGHET